MIAWSAGDVRPYRRITDAYYRIARTLVAAKYPAWLNLESGTPDPATAAELGWTEARVSARSAKAEVLFFRYTWSVDGGQPLYFDERRWRAFIRRVARYLAFVDARRGLSEIHRGLLHAEEIAMLDAAHESAERGAVQLLEYAAEIKREIDRRGSEHDRAREAR